VEYVGKQLGFESLQDWYSLKKQDIVDCGGKGLLSSHFDDSPTALLLDVFPNHEWHLWKFKHAPQGFWKDERNQIWYIDWLSNSLKYQVPSDWHGISILAISENSGFGLLRNFYFGSPFLMIRSLIPEIQWHSWEFVMPSKIWRSIENQKQFFIYLASKLEIRCEADWKAIGYEDISIHGGGSLLKAYYRSSPKRFIYSMLHDGHLGNDIFTKTQLSIATVIKDFFPNLSIQEGYNVTSR